VGVHEGRVGHEGAVNTHQKEVEEEQHEVAVVVVAHAIAHPRCQ
jgi:hypothetical protein